MIKIDIGPSFFFFVMTPDMRRLVSWINHLPPACWSTYWKSNSKQQLGCRFDIMDDESFFFFFFFFFLGGGVF